ncbi:hypothetical protein Tco_0135215 [Tanacetum coccineum]
MVLQLTDFTSEITDEELREFTSEYYIPSALHPVVPAADASIADFPVGKVGVYTRFFEFANQRVPLSLFMCNILNHYRLHISQLHCIGAAKISNFEVNCRLLAINPTVHLFRAFYHTCWSNGWVSFSKRAGRLQCYTEKLDALRRWREMFFWVDDMLVPSDFAFYTQGLLPRDERPPPGSYSIEDAELINENRIPINAYSEAFLCHMGISRNYFQRPEEVPTFIGEDGRGGCLSFLLPHLVVQSTGVLAPTPLRSVPGETAEPPRLDATSVGSSEDADVAGAESEAREVDSGLKRKRATSDDDAGTSKRVRHVSLGLSTSTEEETPDAPPTLAAKEVTETPPPNVEATSDSSAPVTHAAQRKEILLRQTQLAIAAEAESSMSYAQNLGRGKNGTACQGGYKAISCSLLPYTFESHSQVSSFGDVVTCALARGKAEAVEELHEKKLLTVPAAQVPGYNDKAYEELVAAMEAMKLRVNPGLGKATEAAEGQPDYFLKPDVAQLQVPIFARPRDILNPFALEREIPLKETLEAHAIRLAKKKGVKGKAILCGVGAAHIPRSDGVPVSVAAVSPKDSEKNPFWEA